MKKSLILLIIMAFLGLSCASKKDLASLTPEDEVEVIRYALLVVGVKAQVSLRDVDQNGIEKHRCSLLMLLIQIQKEYVQMG